MMGASQISFCSLEIYMTKLLKFFITVFALTIAPTISAAESGKLSPEVVKGATTINTKTAKSLFDQGVVFIDVRKDKDWQAGRIPGAEHLELHKVFNEASLGKFVKKNQMVVFYCNGPKCLRSSHASAEAVKWGFTKVNYFRGGFPAWKEAGLPVE